MNKRQSQIFILGDTHGTTDNFKTLQNEHEVRYGDFVIVCGDFGFIWNRLDNTVEEELKLDWLNRQKWITLFIDGNHENFERLNNYPLVEFNGARAHQIRNNVYHIIRGEIMDLSGRTFFCYGGAQSIDRAYRVVNESWWYEEVPSRLDYDNAIDNLEKYNYNIDYIITHEMPDLYGKELYGRAYRGGYKTSYQLNDFLYLCTFKKWYCGHHHIDVALRSNFQVCFKGIYKIGEG